MVAMIEALFQWYKQDCSYFFQVSTLSFVSSIIIGFSSICYVNFIDQMLIYLIGGDDTVELFSGKLCA